MKSITDASVSTENLVNHFLEQQALEIAAREREQTAKGNGHFDKLRESLLELAKRSSGRDALEALLQHNTPEVRLRAAWEVMAWAPEKAIPVLGRLVATWMPRDINKGYVPVRGEAKGALYRHFGIKDYDQNKLIEPLRAYGVELSRRPEHAVILDR